MMPCFFAALLLLRWHFRFDADAADAAAAFVAAA